MTQPPLARNACQQRSHKGRLVPGEPGKGIDASHGDLARDRHPWPWMCYSPMHSKSTGSCGRGSQAQARPAPLCMMAHFPTRTFDLSSGQCSLVQHRER
jgi:hypothetical protein